MHAWKVNVDRISAWQCYAVGMVRWVYSAVHPTAQPVLGMCYGRHTLCLSSGFIDWSCNHISVTSALATSFLVKVKMYRIHKIKKKQKENTYDISVWTCNIVCVTSLNQNHKDLKVDSAYNRNEYQEYFLGYKVASAQGWHVYHLNCRSSGNLGASTSWNPQGFSGPVIALLTFLPA